MQVKIKNEQLGQVINLLFDLSLKGKQSRQRSKFIKVLDERIKEVAEQEQELLKEHCHLDDEGNPKIKNNGQEWDVKNVVAFRKDKIELLEEEIVLDGGDNEDMLKTVKTVLFDCEKEFSGQDAQVYDYLCDQFEESDE
ncbi:DUF1617 family protein [Jeotgalibacillus marinus]|uniref:DUF1617 family protein n=1 Tax=Jeotgalibacillus marinus TaxID=86667 RepID=A0ABV3Q7S0_9BACL